MLEHNNIIWGSKCTCGEACFILQNKFHPWVDKEFIAHVTCPNCKKEVIINQGLASAFYNEKIVTYYEHVSGNVIDLGCGGGFLSRTFLESDKVNKIYGLDVDDSVKEYIHSLQPSRLQFIHADVKNLSDHFSPNSIDYLVHRDVFMFIEDTKKYFDDVERIVTKGIVHMGWFVSNNERMKNNLLPEEIKHEYIHRGFDVRLEYLNWYKCGYVIIANKI